MTERAAAPYLLMAAAVACVSLGSILVRAAQAPALAVSFQRVFLASLLLAPFAARPAADAWPRLPLRRALLLAAAGVALALHFATWIASLSFTTVAASVLLVNTAPLFSLALARVFLGETAGRSVLQATALALAGAVLIAAGDWTGGAQSLTGVLLALAGAATLSVYHVIGRGLRDAMPLSAYVLAVWSTAAAALWALGACFRVPLFGYPARTVGVFFLLALVPTLCGHGLVNRALRELPAPTVGLFMLGEPIGAALLAFALFGEVPSPLTLAGGALVLAALVWLVRGGRA